MSTKIDGNTIQKEQVEIAIYTYVDSININVGWSKEWVTLIMSSQKLKGETIWGVNKVHRAT